MTFRLAPDQIQKSWETATVEVIFDPTTGNIKPWEVYGVFIYPHKMKKHWGSFKTEKSAQKNAEKHRVFIYKTFVRGK